MKPSTNFLVGLILAAVASSSSTVDAFSSPVFQEATTLRRTTLSKREGVEIELPNFDELFGRIQQVSPLAKLVVENRAAGEGRGFAAIDDVDPTGYKWKTIDSNKRRTVHQIDRIDNFQNLGSPIIRLRSSLKGPLVSEKFANFIMDLEEREKWDPAIAQVEERYPIYDLAAANLAMGVGRYGDCSKLGVGYCRTKQNVVSPREQLTLCGVQNFMDGSSLIWGTEMEEWHNHLMPPGQRHTRTKSHLFSVALAPTGPDTFDVEYILQLEIGGKVPNFLITPVVCETVKKMFAHAKEIFEGKGGELEQFMQEQEARDSFAGPNGILMTP